MSRTRLQQWALVVVLVAFLWVGPGLGYQLTSRLLQQSASASARRSPLRQVSTDTENAETSHHPDISPSTSPQSSTENGSSVVVKKAVWTSSKAKPAAPSQSSSNKSSLSTNSIETDSTAKLKRSNYAGIQLSQPMLYVRYRVPRVVTDVKQKLLEQQSTFAQAYQDNQKERLSKDRSNGGPGGYNNANSGERRVYRPQNGAGSNSYNNYNNGGGNGGGGGNGIMSYETYISKPVQRKISPNKPRGGVSAQAREAEERRRSAARSKNSGSKGDNMGSDEDFELDEDGNALVYDEDEYGEDVPELSSIEDSELVSLEEEGLELADIRNLLFSEYGIKTTFGELKARMAAARMERTFKKRTGKTRKDRFKAKQAKYAPKEDNSVALPADETIQIRVLGELMDVGAGELVKYLMMNEGLMITMNQQISREVAVKVITAFGKEVRDPDSAPASSSGGGNRKYNSQAQISAAAAAAKVANAAKTASVLAEEAQIIASSAVPRPPVVTIMGHVDHGKTTLLDRIRDARVALSEAGGITQAISAFSVPTSTFGKEGENNFAENVTFIDTPGHAAFSQMRLRGAKMTDIVVLVVAADDGVMEQTKECIDAARLAQCPIVVAINKVDKEGANVDRVKQELLSAGLLLEELGGEVQCAEVSAKTGVGLDDLLEKILLQAEVMSLAASVSVPVEGTVIEGSVDKGLGVVVTALVQQGRLRVGQTVVAGTAHGKVRLLLNDRGQSVQEVGPSTPVRIIGLNRVPSAGDPLIHAESDDQAREMAETRLRYTKQRSGSMASAAILATAAGFVGGAFDARSLIKIPVVIKADVGGSLEALITALQAISSEDDTAICKIDVVYSGVGDVTTSDVSLAAAAKAQVLAFNVAATGAAQDDARAVNVDIQYFDVLYSLLDAMKDVVDKTITPPAPGLVLGTALIKKIFKIGKSGKIAGCTVETGKIVHNAQVRVLRGKVPIFVGVLSSLKVVKAVAEEVPAGSDCGMTLKGFEDFVEGDVIECYQTLEEENT